MKPQQVGVPGAGNLTAGEIAWDMPAGKHRVRYRRPDGVTLRPVTTASQDEAFKVYLEWVADLQERAREAR
jgi:hypothetical protein